MILKFIVGLFLFLLFLKVVRVLALRRTKSNACLVGKTAIVTGGNLGIGYYTSLKLASRGCKVIIACRSDAENVRKDIVKYSENPNVVTKYLDLSSFSSIRKFAEEINRTENRLDILINNSGVNGFQSITKDGVDTVMQVNHYGPFLLTILLTDLLKKSAPSRIIFVSSLLALFHSPKQSIFRKNLYYGLQYCNSKFFNIVAAKMFAEKLKSYGVTSNSVHPGVVRTQINDPVKNTLNIILFDAIFGLFKKTPEEGSETQFHVAISKKLEKTTGKFFMNCRPFWTTPMANDVNFRKKVWRKSEEVVRLSDKEKIN